MRVCIPDAISESEAKSLRSDGILPVITPVGSITIPLSFEDPRLHNVLKLVFDNCAASIKGYSYVRIECQKDGHPWHIDTGDKDHMSWCRFSTRLLLDPEDNFTDGGFFFEDEPDNAIFGYRQLWIYDSIPENMHRVASHKGQRRVLLMFLESEDEND
jgi:hypothetical protein